MNYNDLAKVYEKLMGNHYTIKTITDLDFENESLQGVMYPTTREFSIDIKDVYAMEMYFEFYININAQERIAEFTNDIKRITGKKSGVFESGGKEYTYDSFLDFTRPIGVPVIDGGEFKQLYSLAGTCFVSAKDSGVRMSNDVKTYMSLTYDDYIFENVRIYDTSRQVNNTREVDSPTKANTNESITIVRGQSSVRTLNMLAMRDSLSRFLIELIEVKDSDIDLEIPIKLTTDYGDFTIEKDLVITSGQIIDEGGSFLNISLNLQRG